MATKRQRTEIILETHEVTVIRNRDGRIRSFCNKCQKAVNAMSEKQAKPPHRPAGEQILQLESAGEIHLVKTRGKIFSLYCGASLEKHF